MNDDVINLGVLAHVDAGKTSLTERLLFEAGAIDRIGSVDAGNTQTDSGMIERARGITIRSAVASFRLGNRQYNLIDTPGHTDFVAEVERALTVLDAVILVVSAVEGVQPQTRALMRAIRQVRVPTVVMVNKLDIPGARGDELLDELRAKLGLRVLGMGLPTGIGTADADFSLYDAESPQPVEQWWESLAECDDELLRTVVENRPLTGRELWCAVRDQTSAALAHPVVFGSAITGAGVRSLLETIDAVIRPAPAQAALRTQVFAIERGERDEKVALVRCFGGVLRARQYVDVHGPSGELARRKVRGLEVLTPSGTESRDLTAGHIARVSGVPELRIGDQLGVGGNPNRDYHFPPPSLQTAVRPRDPADGPALHAAIIALAEQDPLIKAGLDPTGATMVHLYGDVQREVLEQTLKEAHGLDATFEPPRIMHVERPVGTGAAVEMIGNGFLATVGLRVEPGPGYSYRREVELGSMANAFHDAVEETVRSALKQGCYGWPVVDIHVTMTHSGFWPRPYSAAGDYRDVTPHVLMQALAEAGTRVYEPLHRFWIEVPEEQFGAVASHLSRHEARIDDSRLNGGAWLIEGQLPLRRVNEVQRQLIAISNGEALWASYLDGDQLASVDSPPVRTRTDGNPVDRIEYLRFLSQR